MIKIWFGQTVWFVFKAEQVVSQSQALSIPLVNLIQDIKKNFNCHKYSLINKLELL